MIETLALVPWEGLWPYLLSTLGLGYLAGSIPFGLIFGWMSGAGDIRKIGSGNIGATNVLRTGKRWAAAATLICDAAKGYAAVEAGDWFGGQVFSITAALGAFLGHLFPIWLGFKGGKGVATFIGIMLGLEWTIGLLTCVSWLTTARAFRFSSLAALLAAAVTPLYFYLFGPTLLASFALLLCLLIFFTHRANIVRLIRGREPKIGAS